VASVTVKEARSALAKLRAMLKDATQKEVAKVLGCTQAYVSQLVNEVTPVSKKIHELLTK
jgi:DNA-directed RNA polymerase specialized sigma subunit